LAKPTSFAAGKHHSKNAPLSVDKSAFFVGGATRYFAFGEYTLALRLVSELPDLRAGYANRILCADGAQNTI